FFSSRRRHTRFSRDWSSDVCSSDLCSLRLLLFERHALLKAQAKDYIRESQRRLILLPLMQRCLTIFGQEALGQQFQSLLATLHKIGRASCRERVEISVLGS